MAKRLPEIKIDGVSFNAKYWAQKSLEDFKKEANAKDAAMVPETIGASDRDAWLATAYDLIKKADAGDDSAKPDVNTEELKAEAEAAKEDKKKGKDKPAPQG